MNGRWSEAHKSRRAKGERPSRTPSAIAAESRSLASRAGAQTGGKRTSGKAQTKARVGLLMIKFSLEPFKIAARGFALASEVSSGRPLWPCSRGARLLRSRSSEDHEQFGD